MGGLPSGEALVVAIVGGGSTVLAALLLSGIPNRMLWTVFVALVGVIAGVWLAASAPLSSSRLAASVDADHLPDPLTSRTTGSLTCRPHCPTLTRVYAFDRNPPDVAALTVMTVLTEDGYVPDARLQGGDTLVARSDRAVAEITARRTPAEGTRVTLVLRSHRG